MLRESLDTALYLVTGLPFLGPHIPGFWLQEKQNDQYASQESEWSDRPAKVETENLRVDRQHTGPVSEWADRPSQAGPGTSHSSQEKKTSPDREDQPAVQELPGY